MEENLTLARLKRINSLAYLLSNAGYSTTLYDYWSDLNAAVNEAEKNNFISKQMYQDWVDLFEKDPPFEELQNLAQRQLNDTENAFEQMEKSLILDGSNRDIPINQNSKSVLEDIDWAMTWYLNKYDENVGVPSALDEFCNIGKAIQKAVDDEKLSKITATLLMGPLQTIKDNMYNPEKQEEAVERFRQIISRELERQDEKKPKEQGLESGMAQLGSFAKGAIKEIKTITRKLKAREAEKEHQPKDNEEKHTIDSLIRAIKKYSDAVEKRNLDDVLDAWDNVANEIEAVERDGNIPQEMAREMNEALKQVQKEPMAYGAHEEAVKSLNEIVSKYQNQKDNQYETGLERKQENKDVSQKTDDQMAREDKAKDKNGEKPHTVDSLNNAIENYIQSVRKHLGDDILNSWRALAKEINEATKAGVISKEQADELHKPLKQVQNHDFQDEWHKNAANVLNQWLENKTTQKDVPHETSLEKEQMAKDAPQMQPKPKDLMQREDDTKIEMQSKEQPLKRITDLVNKYEKIYRERGSVLDDDVIAVWKNLTDGIDYAVNNKLISEDMANQLVDAREFLRSHGLNSDKQFEGIDKFKQIIGDKSDKKESIGKEQIVQKELKLKQTIQQEKQTIHTTDAMHVHDLEKKQEAKDAPQRPQMKPEDLMRREDKENSRMERPLPTPEQVKERQEYKKSDDRQRALDNFKDGTLSVLKKDHELETKKLEQQKHNESEHNLIAREAARRRKLLLGRK